MNLYDLLIDLIITFAMGMIGWAVWTLHLADHTFIGAGTAVAAIAMLILGMVQQKERETREHTHRNPLRRGRDR